MIDRFEKYVVRFQQEIREGKAEQIRRNLAAGRMNSDKARAASYALEEDKRLREQGINVFPCAPRIWWSGLIDFRDYFWNKDIKNMVVAAFIIFLCSLFFEPWRKLLLDWLEQII